MTPRYILTVRYVTPSGKSSEWTDTGVYFPPPRDHIGEAKAWLLKGGDRRRVKRFTSYSFELVFD